MCNFFSAFCMIVYQTYLKGVPGIQACFGTVRVPCTKDFPGTQSDFFLRHWYTDLPATGCPALHVYMIMIKCKGTTIFALLYLPKPLKIWPMYVFSDLCMFLVFWRHTIDFKICDLQIFYLNISDLQFSPQNLWPLNFWPNIFTKYLWPMFVFNQEYWFRNYIKDTATSHYFFDVSKILTVTKSKGGRPPPSPPPLSTGLFSTDQLLTQQWPTTDPPLTPTTDSHH